MTISLLQLFNSSCWNLKMIWMYEPLSGLSMNKTADIDLATITDRMAVKKAVQCGNVEDAIEKVNDLNPEVVFLLFIRSFSFIFLCICVCVCVCVGPLDRMNYQNFNLNDSNTIIVDNTNAPDFARMHNIYFHSIKYHSWLISERRIMNTNTFLRIWLFRLFKLLLKTYNTLRITELHWKWMQLLIIFVLHAPLFIIYLILYG